MSSKGLVLDLDIGNSDNTTTYDKSRYKNHGAVTNALRVEKGYRFNGTNTKITVTTAAQLEILVSRVSVLTWMKTGTTAEQAIIDKCDDGDTPTAGYALRVSSTGTALFVTNNDEYDSAMSVIDNKPHFIAGILDGTNKFIVVDDKLAVTKAYATAITDSALNLGVGAQLKAVNEILFTGTIYFAQVYNRGMTLADVISVYNSTKHRYV